MTIAPTHHFGSPRKTLVPSPADAMVAVQAWFKQRAKRSEVRALLTLDRDRLTDMGLTRGDVHQALSESGDPCANLRALASSRRAARNW